MARKIPVLNRMLGAPALYAIAYGEIGSSLYYALGITLANGWEFQNPFIDGYTGVSAYLKAQDISVGIVTTQPERSPMFQIAVR